jgi:hypothetical protein
MKHDEVDVPVILASAAAILRISYVEPPNAAASQLLQSGPHGLSELPSTVVR